MIKLIIIGTVYIASFMVPWLIHRHAAAELSVNEEALKKQRAVLAELSMEAGRLSNSTAQSKGAQSLPDPQLRELLKLRNEISQLRQAHQGRESLQNQIRRLQDRVKDAELEANELEVANAFITDEIRQKRVQRLKQWLEGMPQEKIPELQLLSEDRWIASVNGPFITDDDYRSAIGLLRSEGEQKTVTEIFVALREYVKVNVNQFPSDPSQLQPYFKSPIDDAILRRYEVVPANTLIPSLAAASKESVITQKSPVNKKIDKRVAISATSAITTDGPGRWDPVP